MVETVPAADGPAAGLERRERTLVRARLGVDELGGGVDPREADRGLRIHALVEDRSQNRTARSWTDCVELAEITWWGIQYRGIDRYTDHTTVVLTEAVLSLGGGERFALFERAKAQSS